MSPSDSISLAYLRPFGFIPMVSPLGSVPTRRFSTHGAGRASLAFGFPSVLSSRFLGFGILPLIASIDGNRRLPGFPLPVGFPSLSCWAADEDTAGFSAAVGAFAVFLPSRRAVSPIVAFEESSLPVPCACAFLSDGFPCGDLDDVTSARFAGAESARLVGLSVELSESVFLSVMFLSICIDLGLVDIRAIYIQSSVCQSFCHAGRIGISRTSHSGS